MSAPVFHVTGQLGPLFVLKEMRDFPIHPDSTRFQMQRSRPNLEGGDGTAMRRYGWWNDGRKDFVFCPDL